mgnify:CR=1 FL=1
MRSQKGKILDMSECRTSFYHLHAMHNTGIKFDNNRSGSSEKICLIKIDTDGGQTDRQTDGRKETGNLFFRTLGLMTLSQSSDGLDYNICLAYARKVKTDRYISTRFL